MLVKVSTGLQRHDVHSTVIALRGGGPLGDQLTALGIPVEHGTMEPGALPAPAHARWLWRTLGRVSPDVVHGWMYHGNLAATAGRFRGHPVLWNVRQTLYDIRREPRLTRWMIRAGAALSAVPRRILYNSHLSAAQHEAMGYRKEATLVIPNGFNLDAFSPAAADRSAFRAELGLLADALLVGLVARAHPMKDHRMFLEAASRIVAADSRVHFVLVGTGMTPTSDLARTVAEVLRPHVHWLGPRHDVPRITASLDIACLSSAWGEGFPNVLGEAMACEIVCVTTDIGDAAQIVGDTGRVVPAGDAHAFAAAVSDLLSDGIARATLGRRARQRVLQSYSLDAVVGQYAELYQTVAIQPGSLLR